MLSTLTNRFIGLVLVSLPLTSLWAQPSEPKRGTVVTQILPSAILRENRIGLDANRRIKVYLPPGYATSGKAYPVVYYCHSIFWDNEKLVADGKLVHLLDRGIANGVTQGFILVAADYSTPTTGSVYENSPITGRWLDFTTQELVPFIDQCYRNLRHRDSRAVTGDFMGGQGALQLAMAHARQCQYLIDCLKLTNASCLRIFRLITI